MTIAVSTTADRAMLPKSVRLHETDDILREQLEYLIDQASDKIVPSCSECRRYLTGFVHCFYRSFAPLRMSVCRHVR